MTEELYSGFSRKQLQGLDEAAVSLLEACKPNMFQTKIQNGYHVSSPLEPNQSGSQRSRNGESSSQMKDQLIDMPAKKDLEVMPIAIVGMSCRFPGGANSIEEMWDLCSEGRSAWSEIPKCRFNADTFYHPDPERTTSMNVKSGHFLREDQYGYFDASFFHLGPNEVKAMDPKSRMHLESAYEALENAGLPISDLVGSDTSVVVGTFNEDYKNLMIRDPNIAPVYKLTGIGMSMLANRISHCFDLKGPSITLDTGCSASAVALHMACENIRTGISKIAIVSGANLMLEPEAMLALSSLNFLSPDGKSYMFDQRANGYARGEGIGTIVLKPLSDALKSNDPVHAVIRNTRMNQDGRTPGITLPSVSAQTTLIEETYREAGIDVGQTDFFEAHGTGTQAGDRAEAEALSKGLRTFTRDAERPLYVGSIKSLIGHCEGASGVAGVIHASMALKGQCILPNNNFKIPSDQINFRDWKIKVPTEKERWSSSYPRRASLNSFGYGGTNVHAILEEAPAHSSSLNAVSTRFSSAKVVFLSANEEESLQNLATKIAEYVEQRKDPETFSSLIYTLGQRRSLLRYRFALRTTGNEDLTAALRSTKIKAARVTENPRLCFVFTGQGAQWAGMGQELLKAFPVYQATVYTANTTIADLGAEWSLLDELLRDSKTSKINAASLSQPLCTALQIALVELLRSWGINPVSVVGHSSGEIAAAYCAGMLSLQSAMQVAYYRGKFAMEIEEMESDQCGRMMAVGQSHDQVQPQLLALKCGRATIACVNSPKSVTVSGDETALDELHKILEAQAVFNRMLRVKVAYHSYHMKPAAQKYANSLRHIATKCANPDIKFNSTVFPGISLETNAEYWVQNLLQPVQFNDAVQRLCSSQPNNGLPIAAFVEIGPHSALAGPLRQICTDLTPNSRPIYLPSVERGRSGVDSMLDLASHLFTLGIKVDAGEINFASEKPNNQVLTDLPPYPWNHASRYWHEGRISRNHRQREFPPHDLLGTVTDESSGNDMRWTNQLRLTQVPWLRDHALKSEVLFPGAGYIAMAIEAASQKASFTDSLIEGFVLREVSFPEALMIPETSNGVEISLLLEPLQESSMVTSRSWDRFRILSYSSDRKSTQHCCGLISTCQEPRLTTSESELQALAESSPGKHESSREYDRILNIFRDSGIEFGDKFRLLSRCSLTENKTTCDVRIPDTRSSMPYSYESPQVASATVLDASLQVAIFGIVNLVDVFDGPPLPTFIKEIFVSKDMPTEVNHTFRAHGSTNALGRRNLKAESVVLDQTSARLIPVIRVKGARFIFVPALKRLPEQANVKDRNLCWNTIWKPDVRLFNQDMVEKEWMTHSIGSEELAKNALIEKAAYFCIRKTLKDLPPKHLENMSTHHQYYVKWAHRRLNSGDAGSLPYKTVDWETSDEEAIQSTLHQAGESGPRGRMTVQVGRRLLDVLLQKIDPLSLMMEDDLLHRYYADQECQDRAYSYVAHYVDLAAHKWPDLKVLEIGSGTGSATSFALKALGSPEPRCSSYVFTDISAGFFEKARSKFAAWNGPLDFKTLNIENDIRSQGFEPEGYDLIIAANVLHATADMDRTMKNVHTLLRPGGKLVLVEATNSSRLETPTTFGLLPGWWMGVASGREDGPLLSEEQWDSVLQRTGFSGLDICARDVADPEKYILSTIMSSKRADTSKHSNDIAILHASQSDSTLAQRLAASLHDNSWHADRRITSIEGSSPSSSFYVVIDKSIGSILPNLTEEQFEALQQIFAAGKGLLWVTFNGQIESENAEAAAVSGFIRVLRSENANMRCVTLDLQPLSPTFSQDFVSTISFVLNTCFTGDLGAATSLDLEYAVREGQLMIPRLVADHRANGAVEGVPSAPVPELQPLLQADNPLQLEMRHVGTLDSFHFASDSRIQASIDEDEVEIEVKSAGLNFRDLSVATGQLANQHGFGGECSGIVTKVGRAVDNFHPGQRVCAIALGSFGTHTRTHRTIVSAIPESMSFELAASIPIVFGTAYHSLYHAARLQPGETILIHSAAGGLGQACIKLASLIGATIFATVGTPAKADFLEKVYGLPRSHILNSRDLSFAPKIMDLTAERGVDVIVNSLAGDALRESWRCIAMFGRFIELGKKDALENTHLGMAPFKKSVSYIAIDYIQILVHKRTIAGETVRQVLDMFARGALTPLEPIAVFSMSEIEKAFRFMQSGTHMGKVVINVSRECSVPVVPKPLPGLRLSSDASYLIIGGLGGIGAAFARWMVSKWGAKHLILLSRSGRRAKGASALVSSLQQAGATVEAVSCDVANAKQLQSALQDCSKSYPPIRGVIQGALALEDSIFTNMTLSKFLAGLDPKIKGTKNLHDYFLSQSSPLDFFVMLSSVAGIYGSPSQSNYAAGNTYQDALACHRVAMGLPAFAIDVGMVVDAGWSFENWDTLAKNSGLTLHKHITTEHLLRLIEHNILNSTEH